MRARPAPGLLACLLLLAPAGRADDEPQSLAAIVPAEAYSLSYHGDDPSLDFMWANTWRVFAAIREAGFDDIVLRALEHADTPPDEVAKLRRLRDTIAYVFGDVDWKALFDGEIIYAESLDPALPRTLPFPYPSSLLGCRVALEDVPGLERSLLSVLQLSSKILPDRMTFETRSPPATGAEGTRLHRLAFDGEPLVSMAVRGDVLLFGLGGERLFEGSLALLEGRGGESVLHDARFREAFAASPDGAGSTYVYMDVGTFVGGLRDLILAWPTMQEAPPFVGQIVDDLAALCGCFDTLAVTTRAEGRDVVTETYVTFDDAQIAAGNPLYQALVGSATAAGLLDFVPADATAFSLSPGRDLGPLYRWLRERLPVWVPEAREGLLVFDLAQAAIGIEVERDLLACVGSASVTVSVPSDNPTPLVPEDAVTLVALRDKEAARRLVERGHMVWQVLEREVFEGPFAEELEQGMPRIDIVDVEGSFPGLRRMRMSTMAMPVEVVYGFVGGKYFALSNSVTALEHVMATGAGEVDDYRSHPALQHSGRLPDGALLAGSLAPYASQLEQIRGAIQFGGGIMQMGLAAAVARDPQHSWLPSLVGDIVQGVGLVLESADVREDGVCWRQVRDDGRLLYSRTTDRYKELAAK